MSKIRFAIRCDICRTRGPEYDSSFALACRECGVDTCKKCRKAGSEREPDAGFAGDCVCLTCAVLTCKDCSGTGFVAEPRWNGGQDAQESECETCHGMLCGDCANEDDPRVWR